MADLIKVGDAPVRSQESQALSLSAGNLMSEYKSIVGAAHAGHDSSKPPLDGLSSDDQLLAQFGLPPKNAGDLKPKSAPTDTNTNSVATGDDAATRLAEQPGYSFDTYAAPQGTTTNDSKGAAQAQQELNKLDSREQQLREAYKEGLPTNQAELKALQSVIENDQNIEGAQKQYQYDLDHDQTSKAWDDQVNATKAGYADKQIDLREHLGDVALTQGDASQAVNAYASALEMLQSQGLNPDGAKGQELFSKLQQLGLTTQEIDQNYLHRQSIPTE